ncbi:hypothetical protein [Prevotella sp.]|uniref:hypothetical protein n=1 Tax=Prevotella sp. TaxID=59823 RepID=UPI002F9468BE
MKNKIFLVMYCFWSIVAMAQQAGKPTSYEAVTSIDNMNEGEDYFITYKNVDRYYAFAERGSSNDLSLIGYSHYKDGVKVDNIMDKMFLVTSVSNLFRLEKRDGRVALVDKKHGAYLANSRDNFGSFKLKTEYDESCAVTFSKSKTGIDILIDGKYLRLRTSDDEYRLYSSKTSAAKDITILHVEYGEKYVDKVSGWGVDTKFHATSNIHFKCNFVDDTDNTFIAPFYVYDYKKVFGNQVTAYEIDDVNENELTFHEVKRDLKADTPYILTGKFDKTSTNEYIARATQVAYEGMDIEKTVGNYTFKGVYRESVDVSGKDSKGQVLTSNAFILYNGAFYATANSRNIKVAPYRWYFTRKASSAIKMNKIAFKLESLNAIPKHDTTTSVNLVHKKCINDERIFDLWGRVVREPLRDGIYIQNGKKFVVRH